MRLRAEGESSASRTVRVSAFLTVLLLVGTIFMAVDVICSWVNGL